MKVIQALRLCLEALGLAALLAVALFWTFPGALQGLGLTEAMRSAQQGGSEGVASPIIAPADLVAVLLTVVTMMLGVLAFIVSLAAIVGYNAVRDSAIAAAGDAARVETKRMLPDLARVEAVKAVEDVASPLIVDAATRATESALQQLASARREEEEQGKDLLTGEAADAYAGPSPSAGHREQP